MLKQPTRDLEVKDKYGKLTSVASCRSTSTNCWADLTRSWASLSFADRLASSKTMVNPKFLPRVSRQINLHYLLMLNLCNKCIIFIFLQSEDEKEMVSRTVYCTNIDKKVCFVLYHFCFPFIMVMLIGEASPQICGGKACLGFSLPQTPLVGASGTRSALF